MRFIVPFNKPVPIDVSQLSTLEKFSGDGFFTAQCSNYFEREMKTHKSLLTTSCTHALEMAALLLNVQPGDEVIVPSYTFVSTANAFVLRGAQIVFVDIRPDTMNLDERLIEAAITPKTKVIVPVHYAGIGCEMDAIMQIAQQNRIAVVEDAAQGLMASYHGRALGTIGDIGTYSFHETKNYHCGEGGALLLNLPNFKERAEIIREKGTNRSRYFRGQVDKYTWVDLGSSYLLSEINAAILWQQLAIAPSICSRRLALWENYYEKLTPLAHREKLELPHVPAKSQHNGHIFYIKLPDLDMRTKLTNHLTARGIQTAFHYVPLHSSPAGIQFGRFHGVDHFTTKESERLLRLPMFYEMTDEQLNHVCQEVSDFFND